MPSVLLHAAGMQQCWRMTLAQQVSVEVQGRNFRALLPGMLLAPQCKQLVRTGNGLNV